VDIAEAKVATCLVEHRCFEARSRLFAVEVAEAWAAAVLEPVGAVVGAAVGGAAFAVVAFAAAAVVDAAVVGAWEACQVVRCSRWCHRSWGCSVQVSPR
jgi:hypothetical protein